MLNRNRKRITPKEFKKILEESGIEVRTEKDGDHPSQDFKFTPEELLSNIRRPENNKINMIFFIIEYHINFYSLLLIIL